MVDLQPGDPQTCDAVICNPPLPGKEFFLRKFIAAASFLEIDAPLRTAVTTAALAPCDPAFCV